MSIRIPAEWEPHEATWIGWPHNKSDWPGKFAPISWVYCEIARYISRSEKVRIIVEDKNHEAKARKVLKAVDANLDNIEFYKLKTNRGWMRDLGPAFVKDETGNISAVSFRFNGWAKYDNYKKDEKLPGFISEKFSLEEVIAEHKGRHVVLEGGSIDCNGNGTLLTTEECLMDDKVQVRNPGFTKKDYEEVFKKYLGITNTIWLGKGIAGDDTHGHVDDLCRFVNKDTVILVEESRHGGTDDLNYKILKENKERLQNAKLEDGSKLNEVYLPMPQPVIFKGKRLPASYANFYISNTAVLVPTFNDPNDRIALGILSELITDRPVIGIHCVDLVWGLGTIHCLTHEQPL
ncbi:MAG: agmatine deiminase [Ignavibacteria bacterium RBG_16_34_14]|nr:MAG: agmatine deiminase [Ignavibacteria bacterium RBG_16_34_14]